MREGRREGEIERERERLLFPFYPRQRPEKHKMEKHEKLEQKRHYEGLLTRHVSKRAILSMFPEIEIPTPRLTPLKSVNVFFSPVWQLLSVEEKLQKTWACEWSF